MNAYISALILLLSLPAPAFAADKASEKKAKQLFVEATDLYNQGEYAQALIKFNDAYDLTLENELLFNIAVCYEKMGQTEKAAEYYGRYLDGKKEDEKNDAESQQIRGKIATLKSGEEGGEEGEEEEGEEGGGEGGKKGGGVQKLKLPEGEEEKEGKIERGGWSHGLRGPLLAVHVSGPALFYQYPGLSGRIGYNFRFAKGKGSLIIEGGYGSTYEGTSRSRAYDVAIGAFIFDWEVFQAKERVIQLFVGGTAEFNYLFRNRRANDRFYALGGPDLALEWNPWRKVGFIFGFVPLVGFYSLSPHWAVGFVFKAGVVWGLK